MNGQLHPAYRAAVTRRAAPSQMGGLKKVFRKLAGPVAAAAAIATGQPQLAVAAYSAGKAATAKKSKAPVLPPVEAVPEPPTDLFGSLPQADRNALLIGGTIVGTLIASKLLLRKPKRRA